MGSEREHLRDLANPLLSSTHPAGSHQQEPYRGHRKETQVQVVCESYLGLHGMQLMILAPTVDGLGGRILHFEPGP